MFSIPAAIGRIVAESVAVFAVIDMACAKKIIFAVTISPASLTATNTAYISQNCQVRIASPHVQYVRCVSAPIADPVGSSPLEPRQSAGGSRNTNAAADTTTNIIAPITRRTIA